MFLLTSGLFFSKCTYLWLRHFTSPSTCPINSIFSGAVRIYKIHVFDETFSFLETIAMMTEKVSFSCFSDNHLQGNSFMTIMQLVNPKCPQNTQKNLLQRSIFQPIAKDPDLKNGVKMQQKYFFLLFTIFKQTKSTQICLT